MAELAPPRVAARHSQRFGLREAGLVVLYLGLAYLGASRLAADDRVGAVYLVAAAAGVLLVRRRLLPTAICLGMAARAASSAWADKSTLDFGIGVVALLGAIIAARPASSLGGLSDAGPAVPVATAPSIGGASTIIASPPPARRDPPSPPIGPPPNGAWPEPEVAVAASQCAPAESDALLIHTIGRFQVIDSEGHDMTGGFLRRRVLAFLWLHVLIRALHSPHGQVMRDALADESAPNLDASTQRNNFRKQLWDLTHELPPSLAGVIRADGEQLVFNLSSCRIDLIELRELDGEVRTAGRLLPLELQDRVQQVLSNLSEGDFLPGWEEVERRATRSQKEQVLNERVLALRAETNSLRCSLSSSLGGTLQAQGRLEEAVKWLRQALRWDLARSDLLPAITAVYLQLNQSVCAEELRQAYEAGEDF